MRTADLKFYEEIARAISARSTMRHQVGCVLVDPTDHRHVVAFNRYLGDPHGHGWSMHAEVWGLLRAEEYGMRPTYAFVTRLNRRLARPCPKCLAALARRGVRRVYYTTNDCRWKEEMI